MFQFRSFRNTDVPKLAEIWSRQPPQRALAQPMTPNLMEGFVLSKLHFDPNGFIVATQDDRPVGFAHAGFGAAETQCNPDFSLGVTHRVMTDPSVDGQLALHLLGRSEQYLQDRGAKVLYGGGIAPLNGFYLGLYGGSALPGVLDSDEAFCQLFRGANYEVSQRISVMQAELASCRQPISRNARQWKRQCQVVDASGASTLNQPGQWWQRRCLGCVEDYRLELRCSDGQCLASVTLWNVEPLAACWGVMAAGISDLYVQPEVRRRGVATHLLGEILRDLRLQGVSLVEVQTLQTNEAALNLYQRFGFREADHGSVFRKRTG